MTLKNCENLVRCLFPRLFQFMRGSVPISRGVYFQNGRTESRAYETTLTEAHVEFLQHRSPQIPGATLSPIFKINSINSKQFLHSQVLVI